MNVINETSNKVYHINGDKTDNRKSNLDIAFSRKEQRYDDIVYMSYEEMSKYKQTIVNGYVSYYIPNYHLANKIGLVYEHDMIAEIMLKRRLKKGEVVHHIDFNRQNNSVSNLIVFKTKGDHTAYHRGAEIELEGDVYVAKKLSFICPECGNPKTPNTQLCYKCYTSLPYNVLEKYYPNIKVQRKYIVHPSKEELFELLKSKNFTQIGKQFGVTSNAVKKWVVKYNIDYKNIKRNNKTIQ